MIVSDDDLAATGFLKVARREMERVGVSVPILVSDRSTVDSWGHSVRRGARLGSGSGSDPSQHPEHQVCKNLLVLCANSMWETREIGSFRQHRFRGPRRGGRFETIARSVPKNPRLVFLHPDKTCIDEVGNNGTLRIRRMQVQRDVDRQ